MKNIQEYDIVTDLNPKSIIAESYRILKTNIQFACEDKQLKTIVFTSAIPSEGKSTTVANIAVAFAIAGSKVLLIDADLRRPRVHRFFKKNYAYGLSLAITLGTKEEKYITNSNYENLDLMLSGPISPNPAELLSSNRLKNIIAEAKNNYDYIFIDAPPVNQFTDASILSKICDGVILVTRAGKTDYRFVKKAVSELNGIKANIIGSVLNRIELSSKDNYKYYSYHNDVYKFSQIPDKKNKGRNVSWWS